MLALATGSSLGVTMGTVFGGINMDGTILGLLTVIFLGVTSTSIIFINKKRLSHNEI